MQAEVETVSGGARVRLHGELDLLGADELRSVTERMAGSDAATVIVDLSDVAFIDLLCLSVILATADAVREQGRDLVVTGASRSVRRVCALLHAEDVLAPEMSGDVIVDVA